MEHCVNYARLLKHTEITFKNHSEKVYFFGVIFLCAILPYFIAFASTFFKKYYTKCTNVSVFSKSIPFENEYMYVYMLQRYNWIFCAEFLQVQYHREDRIYLDDSCSSKEARGQLYWELLITENKYL